MGITIEQYRACIGTYNNSVRTKSWSRLERIFWNTKGILFVLAKSAYLLGCIVYVALLLRMANDVEENPGPTLYDIVDPNKPICADWSQSNARKFRQNAGKQCVAIIKMLYRTFFDVERFNINNMNSKIHKTSAQEQREHSSHVHDT